MHLTFAKPKNLIKNTTLLVYADQLVVSGMSFISSIIIARMLGVQGFGIYSIAWLGVLIASSVNQPFIIAPMMTLSGKKTEEEKDRYLQALVFKQIFFAAALSILAFLTVLVMSVILKEWKVNSIILAFPLAVFSFLLQDFFRKYFFIIGKAHKAVIIDIIAYGGAVLSAFLLHYFRDMDAQFILLLTALFFLYASLVALLSLKRLKFDIKEIKSALTEHWDFSKWLTATALLQWFSGNLFIIAAGAILGPKAVGATRMAQNIVGVTHVLFLAMENIIPARAATAQRKGGDDALFSYLWKFTLQMGTITFMLLGLITIFSRQIIDMCYGESYLEYQHVLIGFCLLYVIVFLGYPLRYAIRTLEKTRLIFMSFIISSVFSIACAYPVIKAFGLIGVVGGLMATQLITLVIYMWSLRGKISWFSFRD
ncbi:MAG: lipopolysaccharide biosynthesis protein [Bacteroidota bacterium]